jgi:tripartite ATP-independent transporter DctM subunit
VRGAVLTGLFLLLLLANTPIAFALGAASVAYLLLFSDIPLSLVASRMVDAIQHFSLTAVPLFILMAELMNSGRITERLFEFARVLVGHFKGGLGHANVVSSVIFAGMSGSAMADAAGLGRVEIEAMRKDGYDLDFSAAVTAASCTVGPIIPPSIAMVVYASVAEQSVGRLFLGGFLPGFLMAAFMMVLVYRISHRRDYPRHPRATAGEFLAATRRASLPALTPVILMGGIVTGYFTPTEAAAVAVLYSFLLNAAVYRELGMAGAWSVLRRVAFTTGVILVIFASASVFSWLLAVENVPALATRVITGLTDQRWLVLLLMNVALLIGGCFVEPVPLLIIMAPVFIPLAQHYGIDLIHLGVMMTLNIMVGNITPPFGLALFVVCDITGLSFERVTRATAPFIVPLIASLLVVTYVDAMVLAIPNWIMGASR